MSRWTLQCHRFPKLKILARHGRREPIADVRTDGAERKDKEHIVKAPAVFKQAAQVSCNSLSASLWESTMSDGAYSVNVSFSSRILCFHSLTS